MCDQCRCSSTGQHAAAKYQQLKASWGVAAQTPAKELRLEPGRIRHTHQVFDAVRWMMDLATPLSSDSKYPEISVWLKKHVDISELQMEYVPNESAKKQQTNNLTLLKSPYLRFTADQNCIKSRHLLTCMSVLPRPPVLPVLSKWHQWTQAPWTVGQVLQKTICSKLPDLVIQCVRAPKTLTAQVLTQTVAKQSY